MKALITGLGSIGQHHARNLRATLGADVELLAWRVRRLSRAVIRTAALSTLILLFWPGRGGQATKKSPLGRDWPSYAGPVESTKYSPLDQINGKNVGSLRIAWRWSSIDEAILSHNPKLATWKFEATPIAVDGVLYVSTSLSQVAAIEGATGRTRWTYDPHSYLGEAPPNFGFAHRGVAYWTDGHESRIFIATGDAYLIALDAETGSPARGFGTNGRVDLTLGLRRPIDRLLYGVSSPPVIARGTVVVGSNILDVPIRKVMPPADVRGFDPRTGGLRWTFHTIPQENEYGSDTWKNASWKDLGGANVWAPMSADESLGYVYLPVSAPSADRYGARRPGNNLFSDSLVCLNARTGQRIWDYQLVHHDLWDYDPPAAPILYDIRVGSRLIRGCPGVEARVRVRVRPRDGRTDMAHRRASGPSVETAGRDQFALAANSISSKAFRSARDQD